MSRCYVHCFYKSCFNQIGRYSMNIFRNTDGVSLVDSCGLLFFKSSKLKQTGTRHKALALLLSAAISIVWMGSASFAAAEDRQADENANNVKPTATKATPVASNASLTVRLVKPQQELWADVIKANGMVLPWQDALVAAETSGLRVTMVGAEVGDVVKKGQVLASLASDLVHIEIAKQEARLAQAKAKLDEARSNAKRSRSVQTAGALSTQQLDEYFILEKTAEANVAFEEAALEQEKLRLRYTTIVAPDDGIVSSRSASMGQVVQVGTELFRLIRQSRLIWLAEVSADQLSRIKIGQTASVTLPGEIRSQGAVRRVSPTLDGNSLNGLISINLENNPAIKSGMYGSGEIQLGEQQALTVPESAISWRDGKSFVFTLDTSSTTSLRVEQRNVHLGRRAHKRVEVLSGLLADDSVVEAGAAFLSDGDVVRVSDNLVPTQP